MLRYVSSFLYRIYRAMVLQPDSPDINIYPYAIFRHISVNDRMRYPSTTGRAFLWEIRRDDLDCSVESMTLLKNTQGKQHELVAVSLIAPPKGDIAGLPVLKKTIFFERTMDDGKGPTHGGNRHRRGSSNARMAGTQSAAVLPLTALASSASSMDIAENIAQDIVTIPSSRDGYGNIDWKRAFEVAFESPVDTIHDIYTITFPSQNGPSLLDLAVVLNQVSEAYKNYNIFQSQCYFYAALVCQTMLGLFNGHMKMRRDVEEQLSHQRGDGRDEFNVQVSEGHRGLQRAGTYKSLRIVNSASSHFAEEVKKMAQSFHAARQRQMDDLSQTQTRELREAERRREDAERGREDAELRVQERDRIIEQLSREVDFLRAQQSSVSALD